MLLPALDSALNVGKGHLPHSLSHIALLLLLMRDVIGATLPVS